MKTEGGMRLEDPRLLLGRGHYLADYIAPSTLFAGFVRTDRASGRISVVDLAEAASLQGVRAVFTARDLQADGVGPLPHVQMPRDDGGAPGEFPMPVLCHDAVGHLGEPVALVVAETPDQARDAVEAVSLEIADGPAAEGTAYLRQFGDPDATRAALNIARHRHRVRFDVPRVTAFALEPRGAIAGPDGQGGLHYRASTQSPFAMRNQMAEHFGWDPETIHVEASDVGGSFGLKGFMAREDAALAWAARRMQAEIAWLPGRSETILADAQGRGVTGEIEIGLDADLNILAVEAEFIVDVGAYPSRRAFGVANNINGLTGMYRIGQAFARVEGRLGPRPPLAPFRGNGRPEVTQAIERALDTVARRIGADPVDLRRRNLVAADELPFVTALGTHLDCGDFPGVMQAALDLNPGAGDRRREAEERGKLFGVGLANCIESAGGPIRKPRRDHARLTVLESGEVQLAPGVMSVGQGHETALSRMVAERLQIDPDRIRYCNGDTRAVSGGRGSGGSAGLTVAGSAVWRALEALLDEGRSKAAAALNCRPDELVFREGTFHRENANENISLQRLAQAMSGARWQVDASFLPDAATFPNGCHICEVEIDPETGAVRVTRYVAVEDVGRVLNRVLVEGQLHGGIAQGLSIGLGERLVYDAEGQLLTGSLMDYALARADTVPSMHIGSVEVPTALNPLGVKGVGEAGTVGATAALASAVGDALWRAGVVDFDLPATPARIWRALQDADGRQ